MQLLIGHGQVPTIMPEASNILSNQIMQHKQAVLNGYMNAKQYASNDIDFWDKTLKKCKENFRDILKELE